MAKENYDIKEPLVNVRRPVVKSRHNDIGKFFASFPPIALFALIVVCYAALVSLGVFIGYQKFLAKIHFADSPIGTTVAAIFGLLAFMLAFTFSLTWTRFANRNGLVIYQAKAIGVCHMRTSYLPARQKAEVRKLLHEYTRILVLLPAEADLPESLKRIEEIHLLIWQQAVSLAKEDLDSELRSLFISSVNDMINVAVERKTVALVYHIPDAIWSSLLILAAVGMIAFGYQAGVNGMRKLLQLPWLPVAFGLVLVLIADLNSTQTQRHFKVSLQPIRDVMEMIEKNEAIEG